MSQIILIQGTVLGSGLNTDVNNQNIKFQNNMDNVFLSFPSGVISEPKTMVAINKEELIKVLKFLTE